jgi:CRISPR-associated protein (TIGR03984 family)
MSETVSIYISQNSEICLFDLWNDLSKNEQWIGMMSTPATFFFACKEDGKTELGEDIPWKYVYEARIFSPTAEIRWLKTPSSLNDSGQAVRISETEIISEWTSLPPIKDLHIMDFRIQSEKNGRIDLRYFLIGQKVDLANKLPSVRWSWIGSVRSRPIAIPVTLSENDRVAIRKREYIGPVQGQAREDGNLTILEERLLFLECIKP